MGHYLSEMCCETCGNLPCRCPDRRIGTFIITRDFETKKWPGSFNSDQHPLSKYYVTEKEAEAAVPDVIREQITRLEKDRDKLNEGIDRLRQKLENLQ